MVFVPLQTIEDALTNCDVLTDMDNLMVYVSNMDQIIAAEIFNNNLSVTESRIRLQPVTKVNIRAFFQ